MNYETLFAIWVALGFLLAMLVTGSVLEEDERPWWHAPIVFVSILVAGPPLLVCLVASFLLDAWAAAANDLLDLIQVGSWRDR